MKFIKQTKKGFTMIEMMIATALFAIVMIIGTGAVINVNSTHKKTQTLRAVIDNLHFVTEDMARNMRIGANYRCPAGFLFTAYESGNLTQAPISGGDPQDCSFSPSSSNLTLAFDPVGADFSDTSNTSDQVVFAIDNNGVFKSIDGGANFLKVTPSGLTMDTTKSGFFVTGSGVDGIQPRVTVRFAGEVEYRPGITSDFNLQTTVTQRTLDR